MNVNNMEDCLNSILRRSLIYVFYSQEKKGKLRQEINTEGVRLPREFVFFKDGNVNHAHSG